MRPARPTRARFRRFGALIAVVIPATAFVALRTSPPPAEAAIPAGCAQVGIACLQMYVGSDRAYDTAGNPYIAPLAGAEFGLFQSIPDASLATADGFVDESTLPASNPVLYRCTSDADGDCVFVVPIVAGAGIGPDGVSPNTRLWIAPLGPAGDPGLPYFGNPFWQTGPLQPSLANTLAIRRVFQSPPLLANGGADGNGVYLSGRDWIADPGLQTNPVNNGMGNLAGFGGQNGFTRRVGSGGLWPLSRINLDMPQQCGLDVAFVVDVSSSLAAAAVRQSLVDAMDQFVGALRGTPSRIALFTFGTDSPGNPGSPPTQNFANTGLLPVGTIAEANAFRSRYAGWVSGTWPTNYTNWDRGLAAAAAVNADALDPTNFDLAVMLTDGNPTVYGPNATGAAPSGFTRFREIGNGVASANLLKQQGTRILAVGVGDGLQYDGAEFNLRSLSGRDPYIPGEGNILEADYFITQDFVEVGNALRSLVLSSCAPSVSVVKRIMPFGETDTSLATVPSTQWQFATSDLSEGTVTPASGLTDLTNGSISFDLDFSGDQPVGITITETDQTGFTALPDLLECRNITNEELEVQLTQLSATENTFRVDGIGLQDAISCNVYNEGPPDADPASVTVHKQWQVDGIVYQNYSQPAALDAQLLLSGPGTANLSNQPWSEPRLGYSVGAAATPESANVTITEDITVGQQFDGIDCELTERRIRTGGIALDDTGQLAPASGNLLTNAPLAAGVNEWTVTNVVECTSMLTLVKNVVNGPLAPSPELWFLDAVAVDGASLAGPAGASASAEATAAVTPNAVYQLAESIPDPAPDPRMFHYVQYDIRAGDNTFFPLSTGSWACGPETAEGGGSDTSEGGFGAVAVPSGQHYVCTASNITSLLSIDKTVLPGDAADPASFEFELTALPPVIVDDPNELRFASGQEQTVVPGQAYSLAEVAQPNFQLTALECATEDGTVIPIDELQLAPGATATCSAVNQYGRWTAVKVSDPPSGSTVEPGDVIQYTVTAYQLLDGGVSNDVVITEDLINVVDQATLVEGSLAVSAGTVDEVGATRVWTIPTLTDSEQLTFSVRVNDDAWDAELDNVVRVGGATGGVDCADVDDTDIPIDDLCDQTQHLTPEPPVTQPPDPPVTPAPDPEPPVAPPVTPDPPVTPAPTPAPTPPVTPTSTTTAPGSVLPATGGGPSPNVPLAGFALLVAGLVLLGVSRARRQARATLDTHR